MNLFQRLRARRQRRQFNLFRQFLQTYEQAATWGHGFHCLNCHAVNAAHNNFCSQCGESLREIQEQLPERQEVHTESLPVQPLPLHIGDRLRAYNRVISTDTQEIPLVRLKREERV